MVEYEIPEHGDLQKICKSTNAECVLIEVANVFIFNLT